MYAQLAQIKKIKIDKKGRHVLGTKLGGGGGTLPGEEYLRVVHSLKNENGEDSGWCAKITKIPKPTETFDSVGEIKLYEFHHEQRLYLHTFKDLQGKTIPRVPNKELGDPESLNAFEEDTKGTFSVWGLNYSLCVCVDLFVYSLYLTLHV